MYCRRLLLLILATISLCLPETFALDTPILSGGTTLPSTSATQYTFAQGNLLTWVNTNDAAARNVVPVAGTAKTFYANVATAPGAGKSWAFTLYKNGSATSSTCTIADAATDCSDVTHTVSLVAGDTISIESVPSGTPTNPVDIRFAWMFEAAANTSLIMGSTRATNLATGATDYGNLQGCAANSSTLSNRDQVMPTGGVISKLYVELNGSPGVGKSYAFKLLKAGSGQTLTCTVSDAATTCNDTSNSFSVSAGDLVAMEIVPTGTPTARLARWAVLWAPTIDGEAVLLGSSGSAMNTAGSVRLLSVSGTSNTWGSTEAAMQNLTTAFTLRKFFVNLVTDPGGSATYTLKSRIGGSDGNLSVTIAGGSTTGSDTTHDDTIAAASKLNISSLSASSPASSVPRWGIVAFTGVVATPTPTPTATNTATPTNTNTPGPTATPICYSVTKVTNLNNSGAGSLRECAEGSGNRVCVFETSGRIPLTTAIKPTNQNLYIAGQTAPAPGIMLTNSGLYLRGSNMTVQHLEIRPGDATTGESIDSRDALRVEQTSGAISNVLVDHCSISWATDENISTFGDVTNARFTNNIISEGLYFAGHADVNHSAGCLLWDPGRDLLLKGNIFASNQDRNCLMKPNAEVEFINNIVYQWSKPAGTNTNSFNLPNAANTPGAHLDFIGNYFIPGPQTQATPGYALFAENTPLSGTSVYLSDNRGPTRDEDGDANVDIGNIPAAFLSTPRVVNNTTTGIVPVLTALPQAAASAGARPWNRNSTDIRIISAAQTPFAAQTPGALGYVDCVDPTKCDSAGGHTDTPVPEGDYPTRAANTRSITANSTYCGDDLTAWLAGFEGDATPTPAAGASSFLLTGVGH